MKIGLSVVSEQFVNVSQPRTTNCKLLLSYFIIMGQWVTGSDP